MAAVQECPATSVVAEKRGAEIIAEGSDLKRARVNTDSIFSVLGDATTFPAEVPCQVREMLVAGAKVALEVSPASRDPYQAKFLAMCKEVGDDVEGCVKEGEAKAKDASEEAVEALTAREAEATNATELAEKAWGNTCAANREVHSTKAAVKAAEAELRKERQLHEAALDTKSVAVAEALAFSEFVTACLRPLIDGADGVEAPIDALREALERFDSDPTLIAAAEAALALSPKARGPFDLATIEALEACCTARTAVLSEAEAIASKAEADAEVAVMGGDAVVHVAQKRQGSATEEADQKNAALDEAMAVKEQAQKALNAQRETASDAQAEHARWQEKAQVLAEALTGLTPATNVAGA